MINLMVMRLLVLKEDDSASMAPTVDSQESQDDLIRAGITIENIQPMVTQNLVSRLDNNMVGFLSDTTN